MERDELNDLTDRAETTYEKYNKARVFFTRKM